MRIQKKEELNDYLLKAVQGKGGEEKKEALHIFANKYTGGCTFLSLNEDSLKNLMHRCIKQKRN